MEYGFRHAQEVKCTFIAQSTACQPLHHAYMPVLPAAIVTENSHLHKPCIMEGESWDQVQGPNHPLDQLAGINRESNLLSMLK